MKKSMIIIILATIFMIGCQEDISPDNTEDTETYNDSDSNSDSAEETEYGIFSWPFPIDPIIQFEITEEFIELLNTERLFCYEGNIFYIDLSGTINLETGEYYPNIVITICPEADCIMRVTTGIYPIPVCESEIIE
jgi:hypothetical protein